jgi:hypothetical protein
MTLEMWKQRILNELTSSREASHASKSVSQVVALACEVIKAGFGSSFSESYESSDQAQLSLKTWPVLQAEAPKRSSPTIDAYAAGLVDGEGCISITKAGDASQGIKYARVDIGMTRKAFHVLKKMRAEYGGSINKLRDQTKKWSAASTWTIGGRDSVDFLLRILPYLQLKKKQAELALDLQEAIASRKLLPHGQLWTSEMKVFAASIRTQVMALNKKGPSRETEDGLLHPFARLADGDWVSTNPDDRSFGGSLLSSVDFPKNAMMRNGYVYALPTLERRIREIASSSSRGVDPKSAEARTLSMWPTPDASGSNDGESTESWERRRRRLKERGINGNGMGTPLGMAVKIFQTPGADHATAKLERSVRGPRPPGRWPTPAAGDMKASGGRNENAHPGTSLTDAIVRSQNADMVLNPDFVEALMGFPEGWTRLPSVLSGDGPQDRAKPKKTGSPRAPSRKASTHTGGRGSKR